MTPAGGAVLAWYDAAADRQIVSWEGVAHVASTGTGSFQVHLLANGEVELHFADLDFTETAYSFGASATVGIQDMAGGTASSGNSLQIACNSNVIADGSAWVFSTCVDQDGDGERSVTCGGLDCDDAAPTVFPGAPELCNGVDDDCDPLTDETQDGDGDGTSICAGDCDDDAAGIGPSAPEVCDGLDTDCSGAPSFPGELVDDDGDGAPLCDDCDDTNAAIAPGQIEICDGLDSDCDGSTPADELDDDDADGAVNCADCGPGDPSVYPGAPDTCDGVDSDCDGTAEPDADGDGARVCDGDCDDSDPTFGPNAPELCDGLDNDCDGAPDPTEVDTDGDGFLACGDDCDDGDPATSPLSAELCDGLDNDCDGVVPLDEDDVDADGFVACEECDDTDDTVFPGAEETCNGVDDDCSGAPGTVYEPPAPNRDSYNGRIMRGAIWLIEEDVTLGGIEMELGGGAGNAVTFLVYEAPSGAGPFTQIASETITTAQDGTAWRTSPQLNLPLVAGQHYFFAVYWYSPAGYSWYETSALPVTDAPYGTLLSGAAQSWLWSPPTNPTLTLNDHLYRQRLLFLDEVDDDGDGAPFCDDCDDGNPDAYPGAPELCSGVDEDCDGSVPASEDDLDGDGVRVCGGDCDDFDPLVHADADELCDGVDNDCNGALDADLAGEVDADGDGYLSCAECDDLEPLSFPGNPEVCDAIDNDCDGETDELFDDDGDDQAVCDGDCDDDDPEVFTGAEEVCNGIDDDCDGVVDGDALCGDDDDSADDMAALVPAGCQSECDGAGIRFGARGSGPSTMLLAGLLGLVAGRRWRPRPT